MLDEGNIQNEQGRGSSRTGLKTPDKGDLIGNGKLYNNSVILIHFLVFISSPLFFVQVHSLSFHILALSSNMMTASASVG